MTNTPLHCSPLLLAFPEHACTCPHTLKSSILPVSHVMALWPGPCVTVSCTQIFSFWHVRALAGLQEGHGVLNSLVKKDKNKKQGA